MLTVSLFTGLLRSPSAREHSYGIRTASLPHCRVEWLPQARKLEAQLDEQICLYRRLVSIRPDGSENELESAIEHLLKQLQQVNLQMQTWVSSGGSQIISHTFTRHKEILQDLTQEFYRLRSSLKAKQERSSLLLDFRDFDRSKVDVEENGDSTEHALLKEQAAISRSSGQMDNVISQAQATLGALVLQRSTFGGISTKISNVSSRIPTVNHILSAIRRKKSMDTIILSLVASVCTFLILIYWLSK
ncbi:Golgi SNAP receptor complex member 1-1-like [Canna indica]|uniref:Golgi SNAP receptor complex member 1 n=1 Tax=Canna indica TaxID=4628 RepID=A0AAQ3KJ81_9LILI|nr:Golgi SNAP receptor complex member 1-1-like [Canna indica]